MRHYFKPGTLPARFGAEHFDKAILKGKTVNVATRDASGAARVETLAELMARSPATHEGAAGA